MSTLISTSTIVISMDGYSINGYEIKEMTMLRLDGTYEHYLFRPRIPLAALTPNQRKTVVYTTRHLSGLRWDDGELPYGMIHQLLNRITPGTQVICHGSLARDFLTRTLPQGVSVRDTATENKHFPAIMGNEGHLCGKAHNPRYCSLVKGQFILSHFI